MEYKDHPIAAVLPLMSADEIKELAEDIKNNGLKSSIVLYENKILDGRNRYRACKIAGVEPGFEEFDGESPIGFVLSLNVKRRHLTASQKSAVAVEAEPFFAKEAKQRQATSAPGIYGGKPDVELIPQAVSRARDQAAKAIGGVTGRYVSMAKAIKKDSPELFEKIKSGEKTITQISKEMKQVEIGKIRKQKTQELPDDKFNIIYADPPWQYNNSGFDMSAENKYPTMSTDEICNLQIPKLVDENGILFLWATNPMLIDALKVVEAWGFEYKTNFVWTKKRHTAGFYIFGQHELLLIGTKGSFLPTGEKPKSIITGENDVHSKKPECVYEIIEKMFPGCKYLELFSRNKERAGWTKWGKEKGKHE